MGMVYAQDTPNGCVWILGSKVRCTLRVLYYLNQWYSVSFTSYWNKKQIGLRELTIKGHRLRVSMPRPRQQRQFGFLLSSPNVPQDFTHLRGLWKSLKLLFLNFFIYLYSSIYSFTYLGVCLYALTCMRYTIHLDVCRYLVGVRFFFHHVGSEAHTQVIRFGWVSLPTAPPLLPEAFLG